MLQRVLNQETSCLLWSSWSTVFQLPNFTQPATTGADTRTDTNLSQLGHLTYVRHFDLPPFAFLEDEDRKYKEYTAAEQ
ncbi:hypothetical protein BGZ95_011128, partial [Linnemannia exigua]